jgi:hypothetical protein
MVADEAAQLGIAHFAALRPVALSVEFRPVLKKNVIFGLYFLEFW